jgi:hypothetical protein
MQLTCFTKLSKITDHWRLSLAAILRTAVSGCPADSRVPFGLRSQYPSRTHSQVFFRPQVTSGEENISGVSCPCQPSPRFFSFRGSLPGHAQPVYRGVPVGLRTSTQCGDEGNRTPDLLLAKQALYQLSYIPEPCAANRVRVLGFEPRTSALSELRSSQLSYTRNTIPKTSRMKREGQTDLVWPPPTSRCRKELSAHRRNQCCDRQPGNHAHLMGWDCTLRILSG